jgi:Skp family chaperone for outer membrane proteins
MELLYAIVGTIALITIVTQFGIAAFANAFEASERLRRVQRDLERELEEIQKK